MPMEHDKPFTGCFRKGPGGARENGDFRKVMLKSLNRQAWGRSPANPNAGEAEAEGCQVGGQPGWQQILNK